jgi:hypothetical protein
VLDAVVVLPSQPQTCTRLCAQIRFGFAQWPGCAASQPSPSHTPDAQSVATKHASPSAALVAAADAASGCAGAASIGGGSGFGAGTTGAAGDGAAGAGGAADGAGGGDDDEQAAITNAISE